MLLLIHLFIDALVWDKEKFPYTNFLFEVININFWQIWYFDVKGTGWLVVILNVILAQAVGKFDMWIAPKAISTQKSCQLNQTASQSHYTDEDFSSPCGLVFTCNMFLVSFGFEKSNDKSRSGY